MRPQQEIYSRQETLGLYIPRSAAVVGCGGTGTWTATFLTLIGVPRLVLIDPDTVEISNLNRLPFPLSAVGQPKAEALARWLSQLRLETTFIPLAQAWSPVYTEGVSFVFDCTDRAPVQQAIEAAVRQDSLRPYHPHRHQPYIRVGCDGLHVTVTHSVETAWMTEEGEEAQGYRLTPSLAPVTALAAALGTLKALNGWTDHIAGDVQSLFRAQRRS